MSHLGVCVVIDEHEKVFVSVLLYVCVYSYTSGTTVDHVHHPARFHLLASHGKCSFFFT